ncbi:hypothetical protein ACX0G9_12465 [Flavitalea flava]
MEELTEQELHRIFSWLPFRQDWPVDRNHKEDNITTYYGGLIKDLTQNNLFDTYYSEDGGLGNYLEFICYPQGHNEYEGNAILVCVNLCSPIAAYGQIEFYKTPDSLGWGLFSPDMVGKVSDEQLKGIEKEIYEIMETGGLKMIDQEFASRRLPKEIAANLKDENHNIGEQYLHGLFQKTD